MTNLTTIECSVPGVKHLDVHLAGPGETGGTGPCLCGFDRHQRVDGKSVIGFSVGGGVTGPSVDLRPCQPCAELADGRTISGIHKTLFAAPDDEPEVLCRLVWEVHLPGDRIRWGKCNKPQAHGGSCVPEGADPTSRSDR